jgi:hypothetical protein
MVMKILNQSWLGTFAKFCDGKIKALLQDVRIEEDVYNGARKMYLVDAQI